MEEIKKLTVQVFDFDQKYAEDIFGLCSGARVPPRFEYNDREGCYQIQLELIYDKSSGKYWCGYQMYFIEDAKKEIELKMGEVKIITPRGVEYNDLIVKKGRVGL